MTLDTVDYIIMGLGVVALVVILATYYIRKPNAYRRYQDY